MITKPEQKIMEEQLNGLSYDQHVYTESQQCAGIENWKLWLQGTKVDLEDTDFVSLGELNT